MRHWQDLQMTKPKLTVLIPPGWSPVIEDGLDRVRLCRNRNGKVGDEFPHAKKAHAIDEIVKQLCPEAAIALL